MKGVKQCATRNEILAQVVSPCSMSHTCQPIFAGSIILLWRVRSMSQNKAACAVPCKTSLASHCDVSPFDHALCF